MNVHKTSDGPGPVFDQSYSGVESDESDEIEVNVPFHKRTVITRNISLDRLYDQAKSFSVQVTAEQSPKPGSLRNLERRQPMHISIPTRMRYVKSACYRVCFD